MAGGTFITHNKRRPGAYINVVQKPKPVGGLGERGTVAVALPMVWGDPDNLITLYDSDLLNGKSLPKVGCTATDTEESLQFRTALFGCSEAKIFRSDTGGTKAEASLGEQGVVLDITAKWAGSRGNDITVKVVKGEPRKDDTSIQVFVFDTIQESFLFTDEDAIEDIESEWVSITATGTGDLAPNAGVKLEGGTNGTTDSSSYAKFFSLLEHANWDTMAIESDEESLAPIVADYIKLSREGRGKFVQAVVTDYNVSDYEGIISTKGQGLVIGQDTISPSLLPVFVASLSAGRNINESLTSFAIPGASAILHPISEEDIADTLAEGWFVFTYLSDGTVVVEQDINTFTTFTSDKGYAFSKNRLIRTLDEARNTCQLVFMRNYSGKEDNDATGRNTYKAELISQFNQMQALGAITNFNGAEDVSVEPGEEIDQVVVDLAIQPVDSMEKVYMTITVIA